MSSGQRLGANNVPIDTVAPTIDSILPADGATLVASSTSIKVVFDEAMDTSSEDTTTDTVCSGNLQVSADGFSTCVPMSSATPVAISGDTTFTAVPAASLNRYETYAIRVTDGVWEVVGNSMVSAYTTSTGFSTSLTSWDFVDGDGVNGINFDTANSGLAPELTVFNSKLYACWYEFSKIRVVVYSGNDSSPVGTFVDGDGVEGIKKDSEQSSGSQRIEVLGSTLHLIFSESNGTASQIRVMAYNRNDGSPAWTFIDGNGTDGINKDVSEYAYNPKFGVFNSKLYATWSETFSYQVRVVVGK
ncbi:MAG: Ig-like domain-containing protein [Proteobacteria bacterium]|nr:Ig-like domain-containing protein [Pseudomonadota bacterium]